MGGDGRAMKDGGGWEVTALKYHHPLKGTKNHLLSPAWNRADKASHPFSQIPRMREDSLLSGVFILLVRPNNGTTTCWGLLWHWAQLWP